MSHLKCVKGLLCTAQSLTISTAMKAVHALSIDFIWIAYGLRFISQSLSTGSHWKLISKSASRPGWATPLAHHHLAVGAERSLLQADL